MKSLQARLSAGLIITLSGLVGVMLVIGSYSLRRIAEDFVVSRLEHDMDALLVVLGFDEKGFPLLRPGRLNPIFHQPYSGHYYKIMSGDFTLRSRSLWDLDLGVPPVTADALARYFVTGPQNQSLLTVARAFQVREREVKVVVAEDFTPVAAGLRWLIVGFVIVATLLLGALIVVQRFIVRRGLQPLEDARRDILLLERGDIQQLQGDAPIEVKPLVEAINHLLVVTAQRQQRSRHALGNLTHALKAPLTVLTHLAEHAGTLEPNELHAECKRQTGHIRALIERELKRARIVGVVNPGQRVVLAAEIDDLVATLRKIHRDKPLAIQCRVPADSLFPGDRDDLMELLGNLLDNACQWAAGTVRLTVTEAPGWLRLTIEDDGPGCPAAELELLTRRGVRIDEARAGHGLGLGIVTDIVEQYGGRLRLDRSADLGGFLAEAELPARNSGTRLEQPLSPAKSQAAVSSPHRA